MIVSVPYSLGAFLGQYNAAIARYRSESFSALFVGRVLGASGRVNIAVQPVVQFQCPIRWARSWGQSDTRSGCQAERFQCPIRWARSWGSDLPLRGRTRCGFSALFVGRVLGAHSAAGTITQFLRFSALFVGRVLGARSKWATS